MKDPELCGKIVEAVSSATSLPVTVKIRAGWDKKSINAVEVARIVESAGAKAICVHARTKEQLYSPGIDLSVIAAVKDAVSVPVIGNGDIYTPEDTLIMKRETGCDGVMIARGATGNPWIFEAIRAAFEGKEYAPPSAKERLTLAKELLAMMIADKGERIGIAEAKKHIAWFIHDIRGAASSRFEVMNVTSSDAMRNVLDSLIALEDEEQNGNSI